MEDKREELKIQMNQLKKLRAVTGLNRKDFAISFGIPLRTVEDWEAGKRKMPEYLLRLMEYKIRLEYLATDKDEESQKDGETQTRNVNVITDAEGKKIVLINDIRFKSRRTIDWCIVEEYLKEYIGQCFEIAETSEKVFIGTDFPDEFSHSKDTKDLKGANKKAKANMTSVLGELIQIANNKMSYPDYDSKHKSKAKYGWYRYDTRFGIPVYNENDELIQYNIFSTRMLVRCDKDGRLYLYDLVRTKKETSKPLEQ